MEREMYQKKHSHPECDCRPRLVKGWIAAPPGTDEAGVGDVGGPQDLPDLLHGVEVAGAPPIGFLDAGDTRGSWASFKQRVRSEGRGRMWRRQRIGDVPQPVYRANVLAYVGTGKDRFLKSNRNSNDAENEVN